MRPEVAILLGGTADGRELTLRPEDGFGPETIRVPDIIESRWNEDGTIRRQAFRVLVYRKQRCMGWPSRDDQGRLRYVIEEKT